VLRQLWKEAPCLKQVDDLREKLSAIFEQDFSLATAKRKIRAWIEWVEVFRCDFADLGLIVGRDYQLFYRPSQQGGCGRHEQSAKGF
jgi:hypothetical protein